MMRLSTLVLLSAGAIYAQTTDLYRMPRGSWGVPPAPFSCERVNGTSPCAAKYFLNSSVQPVCPTYNFMRVPSIAEHSRDGQNYLDAIQNDATYCRAIPPAYEQ